MQMVFRHIHSSTHQFIRPFIETFIYSFIYSRVLQNKEQAFAMEQNLEYIKKSIADKIPQKMVVQSRIHARNQRPDVENCRWK